MGQAMLSGALVSILNEVCCNIDAQHVRSEFRRWQCRGAIAASKIQDLQPFCDSKSLDERLSAFPHTLGDARKVAFFPKCFVWIHNGIYQEVVELQIVSPNETQAPAIG